jgi:hypothetical protein
LAPEQAAWSMIPKKPAPDLIRGENWFSEQDHGQTKSRTTIPVQLDRMMISCRDLKFPQRWQQARAASFKSKKLRYSCWKRAL